jgi:hypothetical protein
MTKTHSELLTAVLHSPGCNDPEKICAPHPPGLRTLVELYQNPELLMVPLAVVGVTVAIGLYRRRQSDTEVAE